MKTETLPLVVTQAVVEAAHVRRQRWARAPRMVAVRLARQPRDSFHRADALRALQVRLIPYLPKLLNTVGPRAVIERRAFIAADFAVRDAAVAALRARGRTEHADRLAALPPIVDAKTAREARTAAFAAAADADAAAAARKQRVDAALACLDRMIAA